MGKKTPAPPPPIDYGAAATAQGAANLQSGLQSSYLSNPNITNPYGSSKTTWGTALDPFGNPILDANSNPQTQANVYQTLNPAAQTALENQQKVEAQLSGLASKGADVASGVLGNNFQYNNPNYTGPQLQTSIGPSGEISSGPSANQYGVAGGVNANAYGQATGQADLSNVAAMPVNAGMTGQNAILSRLTPQIQQTEAATAQRLANQGITPGSEAYNNAMRTQGQQANDLYTQAAAQGIGLDLSANQQGYGQAMSNAGLYNSAIGQNFGQGLSAQSQANQAVGQNFGQGVTAAQLQNAAQAQKFNQELQSMSANNAATQGNLQMQLGLYDQPLNQINALMSGSQIQNPTFQAYTGANVNAAPVFQASQQTGQDAQAAYAQQVAAANAKSAALGGLLGAGAGMFSFGAK